MRLSAKLRTKNDGIQKNSPYPIIEHVAAPSDRAQKLGFRARCEATCDNEGRSPAPAHSSASRAGSRTLPQQGNQQQAGKTDDEERHAPVHPPGDESAEEDSGGAAHRNSKGVDAQSPGALAAGKVVA